MNWSTLFYILGAGLMLWLAVRLYRQNPNAFNKENLSKSSTTLALLSLMLIGVIALCVILLRRL